MLTVLIWLLTAVLLIDCLFLVLLALVQLPKKEAGAGLAFGGAATDALFGAGSGTALTKITKYAATTFFVVTLLLAALHARERRGGSSDVQEQLKTIGNTPATQTAPVATPAPATAPQTQPVAPVTTPTAPATTPAPAPAPTPAPANP